MDEYGVDIDEVKRVVASADVLIVRFAIISKRMLLDARSSESEGPLICLVPPASSAEERFRHLKQLRPRFPLPEKITSFLWPRQIETFQTSGVWEAIVQRATQSHFPDVEEQCNKALQDLQQEERQEVLAAIKGGEGYQSLWERDG